jgi:adenine specific DNA methylase Mod
MLSSGCYLVWYLSSTFNAEQGLNRYINTSALHEYYKITKPAMHVIVRMLLSTNGDERHAQNLIIYGKPRFRKGNIF